MLLIVYESIKPILLFQRAKIQDPKKIEIPYIFRQKNCEIPYIIR